MIRASVTGEHDRPFFRVLVGFWSSAVRMIHRQLEYKIPIDPDDARTRYVTLAAPFSSGNHDVVNMPSKNPTNLAN